MWDKFNYGPDWRGTAARLQATREGAIGGFIGLALIVVPSVVLPLPHEWLRQNNWFESHVEWIFHHPWSP